MALIEYPISWFQIIAFAGFIRFTVKLSNDECKVANELHLGKNSKIPTATAA
jgi:hypothetical protein